MTPVRVGVLALQGDIREHLTALVRSALTRYRCVGAKNSIRWTAWSFPGVSPPR